MIGSFDVIYKIQANISTRQRSFELSSVPSLTRYFTYSNFRLKERLLIYEVRFQGSGFNLLCKVSVASRKMALSKF